MPCWVCPAMYDTGAKSNRRGLWKINKLKTHPYIQWTLFSKSSWCRSSNKAMETIHVIVYINSSSAIQNDILQESFEDDWYENKMIVFWWHIYRISALFADILINHQLVDTIQFFMCISFYVVVLHSSLWTDLLYDITSVLSTMYPWKSVLYW